ncbi:MAG: PIG-L deacetylase family protein [Candidatus Hodarchaeales archaeon]|jgi:LmbE family N-acetylglucosaminyl deacetylase
MNVLFLSPHTDDVELGAGGSIIKFLEEKYNIFILVFSTASESLPPELPKDTLKTEFISVLNDLGLSDKDAKIYDFRVRRLHEHRQEILEELVQFGKDFSPDIVIGPSLNDVHQDHEVVAKEMVRAFKTKSSILCYELPWNHIDFNTQLFSKLNKNHINKKYDILQNYKSQLIKARGYFSKEFIFGLANVRGRQCNTNYAEAFEVIRWII